jgi:hypothetical protein
MSFLVIMRTAYSSLCTYGYLVCVSFKISLMKYTKCCLTSVLAFGRLMAITVLMITSVVAIYNSSTLSSFGGTSVVRDLRYCLSSMKVAFA